MEETRLSSEELLKMRLCDLQLDLKASPLAPMIRQVLRELKGRGLLFQPYFWISTEWFCPDGYAGVAVPFFLIEDRLRKIEQQKMGFLDGKSRVEILKILRHEIGHAVENAYALKLNPLRVRTFGSHKKPYPESYKPAPFSKAYVNHLGLGYGQSHPDEDFAETFAVWLNPRSNWKQKYKGTLAYNKLMVMEELMRGLKGVRTRRGRRGCVEALSTNKMTLAEHYRRKQLHFRLPARRRLLRDLTQVSVSKQGALTLSQVLKSHEKDVVGQVSMALGQPKHFVRRVVSDFISHGQHLRLSEVSKRKQKQETLNWITEGSLIYLEKGLDRVVL